MTNSIYPSGTKTCKTCGETKELILFSPSGFSRSGSGERIMSASCKACRALASSKTRGLHCIDCNTYLVVPKKAKLGQHKRCPSCYKEYRKKYCAAYRDSWCRRVRRYKLPGYEKALKEIYMSRPEGYEVDHIIPIHGSIVCGLHVPWNLQYLPKSDNRRKRNNFVSE